uniref:Uncharacterized protein n=1 Tax=Glossina austeni TaxID=7395 RepID=A0A1A9UKZ4_GLOAU
MLIWIQIVRTVALKLVRCGQVTVIVLVRTCSFSSGLCSKMSSEATLLLSFSLFGTVISLMGLGLGFTLWDVPFEPSRDNSVRFYGPNLSGRQNFLQTEHSGL